MKAERRCVYCARWVAATSSEPMEHAHVTVGRLDVDAAEREGLAIRDRRKRCASSSETA